MPFVMPMGRWAPCRQGGNFRLRGISWGWKAATRSSISRNRMSSLTSLTRIFAVGIDAIETSTFGANWSNLSNYNIDDRIEKPSGREQKSPASVQKRQQTAQPGPSANAKAAVNGCKQAIVTRGVRLPIIVEMTVATAGTMLMGSEIGAALIALEPFASTPSA